MNLRYYHLPKVILAVAVAMNFLAAPAMSKEKPSKDSKSEPKQAPSRPAPAPRTEPRRETPSRPAPAPRTEPRRETPSRPAPAPRTEPRRERPSRPAPAPRTEPRRETPSRPAPAPRTEPRRETPSRPGPTTPAKPSRTVTQHPHDGGRTIREGNKTTVQDRNGRVTQEIQRDRRRVTISNPQKGTKVVLTPHQKEIIRNDGTREIQRRGTHEVVRRDGTREIRRANGSRVVVNKSYVRNNVTYVNKTVYVNNRSYNRVYYGYRSPRFGWYYNVYLPVYNPWFYGYYRGLTFVAGWGYTFTPWSTPWYYDYGWNYRPWYGIYVGYYVPYARWYSPAYWLTDWYIDCLLSDAIVSANSARAEREAEEAELRAASAEERAAAAEVRAAEAEAAANAAVAQRDSGISEQNRELIRKQVEQTLAAAKDKNNVQALTLDEVLQKNPDFVFPVNEDTDVTTKVGEDYLPCTVSEGDFLTLSKPIQPGSETAEMAVVISKKGSCKAGSKVIVEVKDLQEMLNEFSAKLAQGVDEMKTKNPPQ